jgi:hypothetical protein
VLRRVEEVAVRSIELAIGAIKKSVGFWPLSNIQINPNLMFYLRDRRPNFV